MNPFQLALTTDLGTFLLGTTAIHNRTKWTLHRG
jgi:hypothetical protein